MNKLYNSLTSANIRIQQLEAALRKIANADRTYPNKKIADDCQYCAREALGLEAETAAKPAQFMDVNAAARALFHCEKCGMPMAVGKIGMEYACECNTSNRGAKHV